MSAGEASDEIALDNLVAFVDDFTSGGKAEVTQSVIDDIKQLFFMYFSLKDEHEPRPAMQVVQTKDKESLYEGKTQATETTTFSRHLDKKMGGIRSRTSSETGQAVILTKRVFQLEDELELANHQKKELETKLAQLKKQHATEIEFKDYQISSLTDSLHETQAELAASQKMLQECRMENQSMNLRLNEKLDHQIELEVKSHKMLEQVTTYRQMVESLRLNCRCLEIKLQEVSAETQQTIEDLQCKVISLHRRNMEKVRRLIAMKLQSSTLRYQLNKYRNEESEKLNHYLQHNEDLQLELTVVKRQLTRPEIEIRCSEDDEQSCFTDLTLEETKWEFDVSMGEQEEKIENRPTSQTLIPPLEMFNEEIVNRKPSVTVGGSRLVVEEPQTAQPSPRAESGYSVPNEVGHLSKDEKVALSEDLLMDFILKNKGCQELGGKTKMEWLHEMVIHFDSTNKCKDQIIQQYKTKIDNLKDSLEAVDNIKKKQKELLQKKEAEISYLIDSVKQSKEDYMVLLEQLNNLMFSGKSSQQKKK